MRSGWIAIGFLCCTLAACAQPFFPVKVNKKWGLINTGGDLVVAPEYDAIGEFQRFGYAIMQKGGKVGLLNATGQPIVAPRYDDLKVLDSLLLSVMRNGEWMVINMHGEVVVPPGYEQVRLLSSHYLSFRKGAQWGVVDHQGWLVCAAAYDEITLERDRFLLARKGDKLSLLNTTGETILGAVADEINFFNDSLIFYRAGQSWGAVSSNGRPLLPPQYETYTCINETYIKLLREQRVYVYSLACERLITQGEYDDYYSFSQHYLIVKKNRQLGLIDECGDIALHPRYFDIQVHDGELFRVNQKGKWGIVQLHDQPVAPFQYDYIAPLRGNVGAIKRGSLFGLVNYKGEEVVAPQYHRLEIEGNFVKAYLRKNDTTHDEALTLLELDEEGHLVDKSSFEKHFVIRISGKKPTDRPRRRSEQNEYVLEHFEWFYSPVNDRWGLRRLSDGSIQIEPRFQSIQVYKNLGFTLAGIEQPNRYQFERTTFRFNTAYGIVKNEVGLLVTDLDFWDVRFEDFYQGYPMARCVFSNGRHGLIDRVGRVIRKDYAFIGEFQEGLARVSIKGRLSGSLKNTGGLGELASYLNLLHAGSTMVDYTQYDRLFQKEAVLTCEACEWGYMDTLGRMVVPPQFSYARDFVNGVAIVECQGKWGMIGKRGNILAPCEYDGIDFLENTNQRIVRTYVHNPKYGLIDTLGQLAVEAVYDDIGFFNEGRLAVKRNGLWGFVNHEGLEVIPCRFREVLGFSEGLAAVKIGRHWGFIDKMGNVVIKFDYSRVGNFKSGMAWAATAKGVGYINHQQQFVIAPVFDKAFDFEGEIARVIIKGKYALINQQGKFISRRRFNNIDVFNEHGLAIASYGQQALRYGVINKRAEMITTQPFQEIQPYSEGLAVVKLREGYGYIDLTGRLVIPCAYSKASAFYEGRAAVQKDGACGYISRTAGTIVPFEYSKCLDFDGGKAIVYKGIRRAGLVDLQGNLVLEPSVDRLLKFREGRGLVRDSEYRFYYITEQAAGVYNGFYERATEFQNGVALVQVHGKWGVINHKGVQVIPAKYDHIEPFQQGHARVRVPGFNGLLHLDGQSIMAPEYEFVSYVGAGIFRAEQGDRIGYFNEKGLWIWKLSK